MTDRSRQPDDGDVSGGSRRKKAFDSGSLDKTVVALPLIREMRARRTSADTRIAVIIDVNLEYAGGRGEARARIMGMVRQVTERVDALPGLKNRYSRQYVFASLTRDEIKRLIDLDLKGDGGGGSRPPRERVVYKVWLDHETGFLTSRSVSTVKADAARNAFGALGQDIVWAVLDTGVDCDHPHFEAHGTLRLAAPLEHRDFTALDDGSTAIYGAMGKGNPALVDTSGHGTHVAGIIAGEFLAGPAGRIVGGIAAMERAGVVETVSHQRDSAGKAAPLVERPVAALMTGMAPKARILSLKVLDDDGAGKASNIIAALEYIQELNSNGRRLLVHGVNLSVGYGFEPAWFACGQSPLCVEVNRMVRSGVVVVVAAGNTGYGHNQTPGRGPKAAGLDITINDPGNADLAITVGATHRDMPHVYGVSYFSSKGPTGDGRLKPDMVAPGEKILSCASGDAPKAGPLREDGAVVARYVEDSGTSMAAPHVSGVIAAFLSIRREFIGEPEKVKQIFLSTATDLGRAAYFQGRGLVDLMRAIQSV